MGLADFIKVYRFLRGIRYPATKQQLMDQARSNHADEEALSSLREMPEGEYSGPDDVSRIIAGSRGGRRLTMPSGDRTRPTTDRVREALFSALAAWARR